jgi:hypothetical protein
VRRHSAHRLDLELLQANDALCADRLVIACGANMTQLVSENTKLTLEVFLPFRLTLLTELVSDAFENLCKDYELTIRELLC